MEPSHISVALLGGRVLNAVFVAHLFEHIDIRYAFALSLREATNEVACSKFVPRHMVSDSRAFLVLEKAPSLPEIGIAYF